MVTSMSSEQIVEKLREWNPHWNPDTIAKWSLDQLHSIYSKERMKVMSSILSTYQ